jgi:hypothetical protein
MGAAADPTDDATDDGVVYALDFAGSDSEPAQDWLNANGFALKRHADNPKRIELHRDAEGLHVRTKKPSFGLAVRPLSVPNARAMRLNWGVSDYPDGVSYEHGIDNEAIMIYVFFGEDRLPSGEALVPDSPYFIGFYLCPPEGDSLEQPYVGHHYQKTGRYVCVDHPGEGRAVVSEIDLIEEFRKSFGLEQVPVVSGISIEVDTTSADNDGHAAAFIGRLEFMD